MAALLLPTAAALLVPVAIHGVLKDGMTSWVPAFLAESFGLSSAGSVLLSMVLPVVNLAGAYAADFLNRRVARSETGTACVLFLAAALCLLGICLLGRRSAMLTVACLALVTCAMLGINTMFLNVLPVRLGAGHAASLSGIFNAVAYIGSALSTWGIGFLVERWGWGAASASWVALALAGALLCAAGAPRERGRGTRPVPGGPA